MATERQGNDDEDGAVAVGYVYGVRVKKEWGREQVEKRVRTRLGALDIIVIMHTPVAFTFKRSPGTLK